jgi:hypothetical protein
MSTDPSGQVSQLRLMGACVGVEQAAWHEAIEEAAGPNRERVKEGWMLRYREFWNLALKGFDRARAEEKVGLEARGDDENAGACQSIGDDPWHGPTNATGCAAWVATTIAFCLELGLPIPTSALRQRAWLARGHWAGGDCPDDLGRLDMVISAMWATLFALLTVVMQVRYAVRVRKAKVKQPSGALS